MHIKSPKLYMWKLIYRKLIVIDQSYEVSCHDKNFVPCPLRFSCPAQGRYRENKYVRENRRVKMFQWDGGDIMQSFAMLLLIHPFSTFN